MRIETNHVMSSMAEFSLLFGMNSHYYSRDLYVKIKIIVLNKNDLCKWWMLHMCIMY